MGATSMAPTSMGADSKQLIRQDVRALPSLRHIGPRITASGGRTDACAGPDSILCLVCLMDA